MNATASFAKVFVVEQLGYPEVDGNAMMMFIFLKTQAGAMKSGKDVPKDRDNIVPLRTETLANLFEVSQKTIQRRLASLHDAGLLYLLKKHNRLFAFIKDTTRQSDRVEHANAKLTAFFDTRGLVTVKDFVEDLDKFTGEDDDRYFREALEITNGSATPDMRKRKPIKTYWTERSDSTDFGGAR